MWLIGIFIYFCQVHVHACEGGRQTDRNKDKETEIDRDRKIETDRQK